jgi:hypothetical protein
MCPLIDGDSLEHFSIRFDTSLSADENHSGV